MDLIENYERMNGKGYIRPQESVMNDVTETVENLKSEALTRPIPSLFNSTYGSNLSIECDIDFKTNMRSWDMINELFED